MATDTTTRIEVRPTGAALGADIVGGNLDGLSSDDFAVIRRAIADHLVLRFRGYALDDGQFHRLASRFGTLQGSPNFTRARAVHNADFPEMTVVSNIPGADGKPIGSTGDGELNWHTDLGFTDTPTGYSFLLAREVPASGGNTSFANMYNALAAMPEALRERVATLKVKHQASHDAQGGRRPGYQDIETDDVREMPGPVHPIIRTHPETGRQALYLGRRFGGYIPGLPLAKSEALLDELWSYAALPENTWTQEWQPGDLVIWDNRCTMHRRDSFSGKGHRRMHRLMTVGERPV